jgi:hypothetical protein
MSIWTATVVDGTVQLLRNGKGRSDLIQELIDIATADPDIVVGLDFGFSFPAWFFGDRGLESAPELWELAATEGEKWLAKCDPPFWGRTGRRCPLRLDQQFRQTETRMPRIGSNGPQSVFKINGAGSVGTGSIRGMPFLHTLRAAGFSIWPFDALSPPAVIEIYPRVLTQAVRKSDLQARIAYLAEGTWVLSEQIAEDAQSCDDAFDAVISALKMDRYSDQLIGLPQASDQVTLLEGQIWLPAHNVGSESELVGWPD